MKLRRNWKKWTARVLVVVMILTCVPLYNHQEAEAADYSENGCVRWVKDRAFAKLGITLPGTGINKYNLYGANNYWYTLNYSKGSEPRANSLAIWEFNNGSDGYGGKCGHVAFVESVAGNNVTVTEGGCKGYSYGGNTGVICRTQNKSQMATLGGCSGFLGYVYLDGNSPIGNLITLWGIENGKEVSGNVKLWAKRLDSDPNHYAVFEMDGVALTGNLSADASGFFSVEIDTKKYDNGNHTFKIGYANTKAGYSDSRTIVINNPKIQPTFESKQEPDEEKSSTINEVKKPGKSNSKINNTTVSKTKPSKVTGLAVKKDGKKKLWVSWTRKDASGYQVQYALNKKFTKSKKAKNTSSTSMTLKKLKRKKIYYVRVRAYKKINGKKLYGAWSKVKKCKVK